MKKNNSIKNKPFNVDNRLKNICAWGLIIAIVLALVGGVLGSLSFFGVRSASAEEVTSSSYSYDSQLRYIDSFSVAQIDSNSSSELPYHFVDGVSSFVSVGFRFTFSLDGISIKLFSNISDNGSKLIFDNYSLFIPSSTSNIGFSVYNTNSMFVLGTTQSSIYTLPIAYSVSNLVYKYSSDFPIYASAFLLNKDYLDYRIVYNNVGLIYFRSSNNYCLRFYFSDNLSDNYIAFYFPIEPNTAYPPISYPYGINSDIRYYSNTFQGAFDNGYNAGYNKGTADLNNIRYNAYTQGKNDGIESANKYSFLGLISAVIDAPIKAFTSLFNFELLGVNLSAFMFGLITLALIIFIVKLFLGGGSK